MRVMHPHLRYYRDFLGSRKMHNIVQIKPIYL